MSLPVRTIPGLTFICCMCEHMGNAVDKGLDDCGKDDCGGPLRGGVFPLYNGPLAGNILLYCYRCGALANLRIEVTDGLNSGQLGFCCQCQKDMEKKSLDNEGSET